MADQIGVELVSQDAQFIASTQKASAAMAALAAQEEKLGKVAADSGLNQKQFSQQFKRVEAARIAETAKAQKAKDTAEKVAQKAATAAAEKAARDKAKAEKQAAADAERASNKQDAAGRRLARVLLGRKALILGEATGIGTAGVAAIELTAAFVAGTVAVTALLAGVAALALKAREAKVEAQGVLDTLTAGRGDQALKLIDGLAGDLGIKLQDARAEFIKFRQEGLDNTQSANLIKLRADLIAAGKGAAEADEAVKLVLAHKGDSSTAAQMALLAKQAGIVGDGTLSAAEAYKTLDGAIDRLDNSKTEALQQIGDKISPSIDRAAQALAGMAENLLKSKEGQKILDDVAQAIVKIADTATDTIPKVEHLVKALSDSDAIGTGNSIWKETKDALGEVASAAWEIPVAFYDVAGDVNAAVNVIGESVEDVALTIYNGLKTGVSDALDIGGQIVKGLISGIEGGAADLYNSITGLASGIADSFAKKLHIRSPSKVFEGFGENTGEGYDRGVQRSMPTGDEIAERAIPNPSVFSRQPAPIFGASAQSQGGSREVHVTVENITVPAGEDAGKWMRAAGHEFGLSIQAVLLSQGAPVP